MRIYGFLQNYTSTDAWKSGEKCDQNMFLSLKRLSIQRMQKENFHGYFKNTPKWVHENCEKTCDKYFFVQTCMCRRCRRKDAFYESIGNALKETVLSWIINTIYIVLPLYQCPYTPSRQRFSLSLEAFSGAITFNVRVYFKHYIPFQIQVWKRSQER